jgi:predicted phosphoribosyltransferase
MNEVFQDRPHAGRLLAARLAHYKGSEDLVVLALPRGGVPVGYEIAHALHVPLDVMIVRKLGVPGHEELAMGAISDGVEILDEQTIRALNIDTRTIEAVALREHVELARRNRLYRGARQPIDLHGKIVLLVDDGLATGASMRAAVAGARQKGAARVVVAVPVGAASTCDALRELVDDLICLQTPEPFFAVGEWYEDFSQTSDAQVQSALAMAAEGATLSQKIATVSPNVTKPSQTARKGCVA